MFKDHQGNKPSEKPSRSFGERLVSDSLPTQMRKITFGFIEDQGELKDVKSSFTKKEAKV